MKKTILFFAVILTLLPFTSCKQSTDDNTDTRIYPTGSIVWRQDTTIVLDTTYILPQGKSLYIEPGVTVIMNDTTVRPEFIVLGNIYCEGTDAKPITFTVAKQYRDYAHRYKGYWGGIICGYDSEEALLDHVIIEYGGAQTTEKSISYQLGLYKTDSGESVPGFFFCNTNGSFVLENCTFRYNAEDQVYVVGGNSIVAHNTFISPGDDGGDCINYKSGCTADVCYNLIYNGYSTGLKLSNNGGVSPQTHIFCYNNTLVNTGWRRTSVKGGSIWMEKNVYAELYNNLIYDCRFALKHDVGSPEDSRSVYTPNFYFASTATGVTQYGADAVAGQLVGENDIVSTTPGQYDPLFVNFTRQTSMDINCGTTQSGLVPQSWNDSWDFHLSSTSPALTGGTTGFTRHFGKAGIEIDGTEYTSPEPNTYFGAFGQK